MHDRTKIFMSSVDSAMKVVRSASRPLSTANETIPSRADVLGTYSTAADNWYQRVFTSSAEEVATQQKLYQLMRLWLLGAWMADHDGKRFVLVSLTPEAREKDISTRFGAHIVASDRRQSVRHTWEQLRERVRPAAHISGVARLVEYLDHKSSGYDGAGNLRLALSRPRQ